MRNRERPRIPALCAWTLGVLVLTGCTSASAPAAQDADTAIESSDPVPPIFGQAEDAMDAAQTSPEDAVESANEDATPSADAGRGPVDGQGGQDAVQPRDINEPQDTTVPRDTAREPDALGRDTGADTFREPDTGEPDTGEPDPDLGDWSAPFVIDATPFYFAGTTVGAPAAVDEYLPCGAGIDESGGELVFSGSLGAPGRLFATVGDASGDDIDVDVHILTAPNANSCVARAHIAAQADLEAGPYWVVVDSWTDSGGTTYAGAFSLAIVFEPSVPGGCTGSPADCTPGVAPASDAIPPQARGTGGCPAGMVGIEGFCIDRFEASLEEIHSDGSTSPWSSNLNPSGVSVRAKSAEGAVPQAYISQVQASAACNAAGKRLCTDTEWLRACRGPSNANYPYGNTRWPKFCNDSRVCHPAVQAHGTTADWIWSELSAACIGSLPHGRAISGGHDGCVTAEGIYDMMGNVHEWTADPNGTFRGGFYVDTVINGDGCLYATTAHNTTYSDYSTGFRCCADR